MILIIGVANKVVREYIMLHSSASQIGQRNKFGNRFSDFHVLLTQHVETRRTLQRICVVFCCSECLNMLIAVSRIIFVYQGYC